MPDHQTSVSRRGPLSGIRVLDLSRVLAGPFCSLILADLGAEVIKIEEIGTGDQTRTIPPFVNGQSHYFLAINRNKRSVAPDSRTPAGRDILLKLVKRCDVVLENFRPGVMERLELGYDTLRALNPKIVVCSISGFVRTTRHPTAGTVRVVGSPLRFPGRYNECPVDPPPLPGEHTREVLRSLAGMEDSAIEKLIATGIVATPGDKVTPAGKRIRDEK